MVNLKELIKQAKNNEIPWEAEIKLNSRLVIDKPSKTTEYKRGEILKLEILKLEDENNDEFDMEVEKSINLRKLLNNDFSKYERGEKEELDISDKNLEGELDLSGFPNLRRLDCSYNQLTRLKLNKNTNLLYLDCSHNRLRGKLDLTSSDNLIGLD